MLPQLSNQAAEAILRMQGEPVLINGTEITAVVIRNSKPFEFGELSRYKKKPNLVTLKVLGNMSDFNEANVVVDNKNYLVSLPEPTSFGMIRLTLREV